MIVRVEDLNFKEHGLALCYPRPKPKEFEDRLGELKALGVEALEFSGKKLIGRLQVLGKGTSALILIARRGEERFALKVRRVDSGKPDVSHEAELTMLANRVGVGPKLYGSTKNMLLMELVDGLTLWEWFGRLENADVRVRRLLTEILRQCRRLDEAGIDHGELSRAHKHVLVRAGDIPCILDFEKASVRRRPANVTSIAQFLLIKGWTAAKIGETLKVDRGELLKRLKAYKAYPSEENFRKILSLIAP